MAVGKSFLDQYSVFCVFGSVVGCVVVPLITQSVESLIFSAIVISLTANRFSKKVVLEPSIKSESKEQKSIKGSKDKDINLAVCKKKKKPPSNSLNTSQSALYHQLSPSELRKQYEEEAERREYEKLREMERKEEEKREKKLKKKEERLKRKSINEKKDISVTKPTTAKEKQTPPSEKVIRKEEKTTPKATAPAAQDRVPCAATTALPSHYNTNCSNPRVSKKYDYYRPNIPRFARQAAAKQRSHQVSTFPGGSYPAARCTPSPESQPKQQQQKVPECGSVIQPKVQSVIGCRKSPEPVVLSGAVELDTGKGEDRAGCYTLFGENTESKDLLSIIRQETGLEES